MSSNTADALLELYRRDGKLTPNQVVSEAVDPGSVLHKHFEWDDTEAAHQYRLVQARQLIRTYKIKVPVKETAETVEVRAFVSEPNRESYAPTLDVVRDLDRKAALIAQLKRDLSAFRRRLAAFEEFAEVVSAIDEVLDG